MSDHLPIATVLPELWLRCLLASREFRLHRDDRWETRLPSIDCSGFWRADKKDPPHDARPNPPLHGAPALTRQSLGSVPLVAPIARLPNPTLSPPVSMMPPFVLNIELL
jgi:hypothetical protein